MAYDLSIKQRATDLRKAGYSIKEIAKKLNIAISSSSVWLRDIKISRSGKDRMIKHKELNRYKLSQVWIKKRSKENIKR
ncbi:hypothetical protein KBD75_04940 [Candidatus Woesebacteria bacterium]|nr:hypothetical protein [Candidatus Woesebacteria bacterium]